MRTKEELQSKEFCSDMSELAVGLIIEEMDFVIFRHLASSPAVKKLIGYYPCGEWQFIISYKGSEFSVIRGMISFGNYEIMKIKGPSKMFKEPERFPFSDGLINKLLNG